jgi:ribulose kinase
VELRHKQAVDQTTGAVREETSAEIDQLITSMQLEDKQSKNIKDKLQEINVTEASTSAIRKETAAIQEQIKAGKQGGGLSEKQLLSTGAKIGTVVTSGILTAIASVSSGSQAKNIGELAGDNIGNAIMGGMTGAMMLKGTAVGGVWGAVIGAAIPVKWDLLKASCCLIIHHIGLYEHGA